MFVSYSKVVQKYQQLGNLGGGYKELWTISAFTSI